MATTRTPQRMARELALQALYQGFLNPDYTASGLIVNLQETKPIIESRNGKRPAVNEDFFQELVKGIYAHIDRYQKALKPFLSRSWEEVDWIEKAILLIAAYELKNHLHTPTSVIIDEAVGIAKTYGKEGSYKFINGVLDKFADALRGVKIN